MCVVVFEEMEMKATLTIRLKVIIVLQYKISSLIILKDTK